MQEEKNRIERVLGAISHLELIQKVLTFALSVSDWFCVSAVALSAWKLMLGADFIFQSLSLRAASISFEIFRQGQMTSGKT